VLVHITPPQPSHVSSSENEGGAQQKLGLILYPKKGFLGGQIPSFPAISPFPPYIESTWQLPLSPFPPFIESTWQLLFPPSPRPTTPKL